MDGTRTTADSRPVVLSHLEALLRSDPTALSKNRNQILGAANEASASWDQWRPHADRGIEREIEDYIRQQCPGNPLRCLDGENLPTLIDNHATLLKDWIRIGSSVHTKELLAARLLEIVRRQATGCDAPARAGLDDKAKMLDSIGFRVIRVPWIEGDGAPASPWPGVSYVNAVDIEDKLFVPEMGLGKVEEGWFDSLQGQLRREYRVVPVRATRLLLDNGGLHCAVALARTEEH